MLGLLHRVFSSEGISVLHQKKKPPTSKKVQAMNWMCRLHLFMTSNVYSPVQLHNLSLCFILPSFSSQIVFFSAAFPTFCSKRSRNLSLACLLTSTSQCSGILETQKISLYYFKLFFNVSWEFSVAPHLPTLFVACLSAFSVVQKVI